MVFLILCIHKKYIFHCRSSQRGRWFLVHKEYLLWIICAFNRLSIVFKDTKTVCPQEDDIH